MHGQAHPFADRRDQPLLKHRVAQTFMPPAPQQTSRWWIGPSIHQGGKQGAPNERTVVSLASTSCPTAKHLRMSPLRLWSRCQAAFWCNLGAVYCCSHRWCSVGVQASQGFLRVDAVSHIDGFWSAGTSSVPSRCDVSPNLLEAENSRVRFLRKLIYLMHI